METGRQRVLKDYQCIEEQAFSLSGMIWLLLHTLAPSSVLARTATHRKTEKKRQLADVRGSEGVGEEPDRTTARESLILYK
jgi:hypothetical protein